MDWTIEEVNIIVNDYFDMLIAELDGREYNKTHHRNKLLPMLNARGERSVEWKHRNISAVLIKMGLPYIPGYKPAFNYQKQLLEHVVGDYLSENKNLLEERFERFANVKPDQKVDYEKYFKYIVDNALPSSATPESEKEPLYRPIKINYLEREQNNRELGECGESLVLKYERWRLINAGKEELLEKIEWVSKNIGDGTGYDILSKNVDGTDRFIEVKTTKLSKETPIYLTKTEVNFAALNANKFFLYRVFNFDRKPQFFIKGGRYEDYFKLEPISYKGYF